MQGSQHLRRDKPSRQITRLSPSAMAKKKRALEPAEQNGTESGSKQTKERRILAGLAQLLDLPPGQAPVAVLTKLADQLGCDVAEDGTLSVREELDDNAAVDEDALPVEVPSCMRVMHGTRIAMLHPARTVLTCQSVLHAFAMFRCCRAISGKAAIQSSTCKCRCGCCCAGRQRWGQRRQRSCRRS